MRILEAQSATLTNYEVYTHLIAQKRQDAAITEQARKDAAAAGRLIKGRPDPPSNIVHRPGNLWTIRKELIDYFHEAPSPLAKPSTYHENTIRDLLEVLRPWDITKGEAIMILNLRPTKPENLTTIIQEMDDRFPGETQEELLAAITKVLGVPDATEKQKMAKDKQAARVAQAQQDEKDQLDEEMPGGA